MLPRPSYDITKDYEQNFKKGPSGTFATEAPFKNIGEPKYNFLGQKVYLPFGIPAGLLLNSKYTDAAFEWGFDVSTYKTVRSKAFQGHPYPNILFVKTPSELYPDEVLRLHAYFKTNRKKEELNITNSFGVPSRDPK